MLISPPFLPARGAAEAEDDWINRCMSGDAPGAGSFPVSYQLGWHGGLHLTAPTDANGVAEPVRAIADGTVVACRPPTPQPGSPLPSNHPQVSTHGWTDNGMVLLRHDTEIGDGPQARVTFYSLVMHLRALDPRIKTGRTIYRKATLGEAGQIDGSLQRRIHFEIVCDDTNEARLAGRSPGPLNTGKDGRSDVVFGEMYSLLKPNFKVYAQKPPPNEATPQKLSPRLISTACVVGLKYAGGEGPAGHRGDLTVSTYHPDGTLVGQPLVERDAEYELYAQANAISKAYPQGAQPAPSAVYELLRFGRVINTPHETLNPADVPHWREIQLPGGGTGWANLNAPDVRHFSDADFPDWKGWRFVDDASDGDSRCDSVLIRGWLDIDGDRTVTPTEAQTRLAQPQVAQRLARTICKLPTDWDASTVDARWGWLKTATAEYPSPFTDAEFAGFKQHVGALAFWNAGIGLPAVQWHWQPREFVRVWRRCGWIDESELAQIYQDKHYSLRALANDGRGRSPHSIREQYRVIVNRIARKYCVSDAVRLTHFFGQGAVESMQLALMVEGSVDYTRNPRHASFRPETNGPYQPATGTDYLYYLEGRLGNIYAGDGPRFRGRGMKQLTGRENYGKYWVHRGWLDPSTFASNWWKPPNPKLAPTIPDPQRLSVDDFSAIDAGGWYWDSGSASNRFRSINSIISTRTIDRTSVRAVARAINGINPNTGNPNGLAERISATQRAAVVIMDDI